MLQVGTQAPDFTVPDHHGRPVSLHDFRGKTVVLWFYPKADTPGWTKQGCGFRDRIREFHDKGIEILGISFDPPEENAKFAEKFDFPFRLLSDVDRKVGLAYGAAKTADDQYAARNTYVIGPDGKIEEAIDTKDPAHQAQDLLSRR